MIDCSVEEFYESLFWSAGDRYSVHQRSWDSRKKVPLKYYYAVHHSSPSFPDAYLLADQQRLKSNMMRLNNIKCDLKNTKSNGFDSAALILREATNDLDDCGAIIERASVEWDDMIRSRRSDDDNAHNSGKLLNSPS